MATEDSYQEKANRSSDSIKKLYRSKTDSVIGGVCGGLGGYFHVDSVLIRIVFIIFAFAGGFGVLLYLLLLIVIPSEDSENNSAASGETKDGDKLPPSNATRIRMAFGTILVALGVVALINQLFPSWFGWSMVWPTLIVILGLFLIVKTKS